MPVPTQAPEYLRVDFVWFRVMAEHVKKLEPLVDLYRTCCIWLPPWLRLNQQSDIAYVSAFDSAAASWQHVTAAQRQRLIQATDVAADHLSAFRVAHRVLGDKTLEGPALSFPTSGHFWTCQPRSLLCPLAQLASRQLRLLPSMLRHLARHGFTTLADVVLLGLKHLCAGMSAGMVGMATRVHAQLRHLSRRATQDDLAHFKSVPTYPNISAYDWLPHTLAIHWARQVLAAVGPFLGIHTLAQLHRTSCDAVCSALAASWTRRKLLLWLMGIRRVHGGRMPLPATRLVRDLAYGLPRRSFQVGEENRSESDTQNDVYSLLWSQLSASVLARSSHSTRPDAEVLMRKFALYKWMVATVASPPIAGDDEKTDDSAEQRLAHSIRKQPWLSLWHPSALAVAKSLNSALNVTRVRDLCYLRQLDWDRGDMSLSPLLRATLGPVSLWCRLCERCSNRMTANTVTDWIRSWGLHDCKDSICELVENVEDIPQVLDILLETEPMSHFDRLRLRQASHNINAARSLGRSTELQLDADQRRLFPGPRGDGDSDFTHQPTTGTPSAELEATMATGSNRQVGALAKTRDMAARRIQKAWRHWR